MKAIGIKHHPQKGAILVVSLVLLTVMTLIGITAMQTTILQEKMAGNSRDMNLAFEAAEAANREGEDWLLGLATIPDPRACNSGICLVWNAEGGATALFSATTPPATSFTDSALWANARPSSFTNQQGAHTSPFLEGVFNAPEFVIEFAEHRRDSQNLGQQQDLQNSRTVYRVTSKGTGGTDTAQSFVQTNFARRF